MLLLKERKQAFSPKRSGDLRCMDLAHLELESFSMININININVISIFVVICISIIIVCFVSADFGV